MKKRTNIWVILAILIIGVPVGYVIMGILNRPADKDLPVVEEGSLVARHEVASEEVRPTADSIGTQEQAKPEAEQPTEGSDDKSDSPVPVPQKPDLNMKSRQVAVPAQPKTEEQLREEAERAEQKRLQQEEQARIKKEKEEERRKEQARIAEEKRQQKAEADRRNAELAAQKQREAAEAAEKQRQAAAAEAERKKAEAERKKAELKKEVQGIVAAGKKSSKVPDGCTVVINGRNNTDYQAFRMGVNYKAYSNVKVTAVTTDAKGVVTRVAVTATESKDAD